MAGRGTDIKLGGNKDFIFDGKKESENEVKNLTDYLICRTNLLYGYVSQTKLNKRSNYSKSTKTILFSIIVFIKCIAVSNP